MIDLYQQKLAAYPEVLDQMRRIGDGRLITLHLFPSNLCNHSCAWCAYRMNGNSNSSKFDESQQIPLDAMLRLLDDLEAMDVQGIEVSGGGEPLLYWDSDSLWDELSRRKFATALVTNGTMLRDSARLITARMKWVRVSIDAGRKETYVATRKCPERHWDLAWRAVRELKKHAPADPEYRIGAGFVLSNENISEVPEFVRLARENGADNVRLGVVISDKAARYYEDETALRKALDDSRQAEADFSSEDFHVYNFIPQRLAESQYPVQDYRRCPTKDLIAVVDGQCGVWTCCTFAGSAKGFYGRFNEHQQGFRGLWDENIKWRREFDASKYCRNACLYRQKNLAMNRLIDAVVPPAPVGHREFV